MKDCPALAHLCRQGEGQRAAPAVPSGLSLLGAVGAVGAAQPSGRDAGGGCRCACAQIALVFTCFV